MTLSKIWCVAVATLACAFGLTLQGDVLVFRDGRRAEGTLVGVRGDTIEFEHRGGRDNGRVRRYDRADVRSIQFDEDDRWDRDQHADPRSRAGMRERTVNVDARTVWTDTGIDVRSGQAVLFSASGAVHWGPGRRDGAAGENNSPYNQLRPMPDRSAAALIGRLGEDGDPFFIGEATEPIRMRGSGRLFLGINDDHVADNSGSLRVVVAH